MNKTVLCPHYHQLHHSRDPRHYDPDFPGYTAAEGTVDRIIHLVGLVAATVATRWLLGRIGPGATIKQIATVSIYSFG
ncbi:MAG: hypothetical protein M3Y41_04570, partial [Pseudomonadota bacterium]|nr:hypothetical protein [Pseudomonadota bacterium]